MMIWPVEKFYSYPYGRLLKLEGEIWFFFQRHERFSVNVNGIVISCNICLEVIAVVLMENEVNRLLRTGMCYAFVSVVSADENESKSLLLTAWQSLN